MSKSAFTYRMTAGDDKIRWALVYVIFALSEVLAVMHAYKSYSHTSDLFAYVLPLLCTMPITAARMTLKTLKTKPVIETDSLLQLEISMRLWMLVLSSYTLFVFAVVANGAK